MADAVKQVVQNYKSGELALLEVPAPMCKRGGVVVRTKYSLISTGTELMKVSEAGMSMAAKARARPDQVAKVLQSVSTNGVLATYQKVNSKLDSYTPLGYSLCGVVEQVGSDVDEFAVGDVVACAGNEYALHGELNWVPVNLCCHVPRGVDARHAAFGTVGAIAMQAVRRGEPQLGELSVVLGLGLIGQLTVRLLVASGVRVVGIDPDRDRCLLARACGALHTDVPGAESLEAAVRELSDGYGADQVYLAAGGTSNEPIELAAKLSRDRGRVVDIGKCGLNLPWNAFYEKELDVRFSRSYGPGRYDASYELEGNDYPIGYVRWTERRNLACFLDLLARRCVDVEQLISHVADFGDAVETYAALSSGELDAVAVLFAYQEAVTQEDPSSIDVPTAMARTVAVPNVRPTRAVVGHPVRVGFIGAGNYASAMLLPHLAQHRGVALERVVTTSALSAANAKRQFGFTSPSTDVDALLDDSNIDAVFIVTRHSSHADLTRRALLAGKAVFVEKPLALTEQELEKILAAVEESGNDRLHVGFNRRFAPLLRQARGGLGERVGPATLRYLINAGALESSSWYRRKHLEGSRFAGEGGHFIDTASWLVGASPCTVFAAATPGQSDLQVVLTYPDDSTAVLTYTTSGPRRFPKETIELLADGKAVRFDDFARMKVYGSKRATVPSVPRGRDKGQHAQLEAFVDAVAGASVMPISLETLVATTRTTFAVHESLATGRVVSLDKTSAAAANVAGV